MIDQQLFTVRVLCPSDVSGLRDVRLRSLLESPEAFGESHVEASARTEEEWKTLVRSTTSGRQCALVAEADRGTVGCVFVLTDRRDDTTARIAGMWVDPASRGFGIGRALLVAALAFGRECGYRRVKLGVMLGNVRATMLYKSEGFEPSPEPPEEQTCGGKPFVEMVRSLG